MSAENTSVVVIRSEAEFLHVWNALIIVDWSCGSSIVGVIDCALGAVVEPFLTYAIRDQSTFRGHVTVDAVQRSCLVARFAGRAKGGERGLCVVGNLGLV